MIGLPAGCMGPAVNNDNWYLAGYIGTAVNIDEWYPAGQMGRAGHIDDWYQEKKTRYLPSRRHGPSYAAVQMGQASNMAGHIDDWFACRIYGPSR
jgi:hypothetical protein